MQPYLPPLPYNEGTERIPQAAFGGLDRRKGAGDGAIRDMTNLCSDHMPVLASRPRRYAGGSYAANETIRGIFSDGDRLFVAAGTTLYVDGEDVGTVSNKTKVFAAMGNRVLIWPDKKMWTEETGLEDLGASVTVQATFADGTYAEEEAKANTILAPEEFDWSLYFSPGDGVAISGSNYKRNNKTAIVREVEGNELRFYENSFRVTDTARAITVKREVPDLKWLCVNDNRVWGCTGDTIRSCKLGDPKNWNVFDGLATDAWSWDTGTAGDFTGCISFLGYPTFFKEEAIFKVYGSKPTNFEAMRSAATGVMTGAAGTLAIAKDNLYYLSRIGFVAYAGGMPAPIGQALGDRQYTGGAAGSDGKKYYVSAKYAGGSELLVYDPEQKVWHREDGQSFQSMAWKQALYAAKTGANAEPLVVLGRVRTAPTGFTREGAVTSQVVFAPWGYTNFQGKYPVRLWLRFSVTGTLTAQIAYDGGPLETVAVAGGGKYLPVPIRRCDSWTLTLTATGDFTLHAIEQEHSSQRLSRR